MAIQYLALSTLVVLYSLMFIGGYISASGLGLTCPEWPQCPNGFMPSAEYFVEWTHRLIAASVGVLVISTMVASLLIKIQISKLKLLVHLQLH